MGDGFIRVGLLRAREQERESKQMVRKKIWKISIFLVVVLFRTPFTVWRSDTPIPSDHIV